MANYALQRIPPGMRNDAVFIAPQPMGTVYGRPTIDLRRFCGAVARTEPVIFASEDDGLLHYLTASGQAYIADIRELYLSELRAASLSNASALPDNGRSPIGLISTIPRSGTFRIQYFIFALNELLRHPSRANPTAHQLYLYRLANWTSKSSPYYPIEALRFLGLDDVRVGHHVPPGALATGSSNPGIAALHHMRAMRYLDACRKSPPLSSLSHPFRPWNMEPAIAPRVAGRARYALMTRDLVSQITSILCLYEQVVDRCISMGAANWSLETFVRYCSDKLRTFVFCVLDGLIPIILRQAVATGRTLTDIVVCDGHLDSLIVDYVIQLHAAGDHLGAPLGPRRVFRYEDMNEDEAALLIELFEFLRARPFTESERVTLRSVCGATNRASNRVMEQDLGHSISFRDGLEQIFWNRTHMTEDDGTDLKLSRCRDSVTAAIRPHHGHIFKTFGELMSMVGTAG